MEADATDQATRLRRAAGDYESAEQQALDTEDDFIACVRRELAGR